MSAEENNFEDWLDSRKEAIKRWFRRNRKLLLLYSLLFVFLAIGSPSYRDRISVYDNHYWFYTTLAQAFGALLAIVGIYLIYRLDSLKTEQKALVDSIKRICREIEDSQKRNGWEQRFGKYASWVDWERLSEHFGWFSLGEYRFSPDDYNIIVEEIQKRRSQGVFFREREFRTIMEHMERLNSVNRRRGDAIEYSIPIIRQIAVVLFFSIIILIFPIEYLKRLVNSSTLCKITYVWFSLTILTFSAYTIYELQRRMIKHMREQEIKEMKIWKNLIKYIWLKLSNVFKRKI